MRLSTRFSVVPFPFVDDTTPPTARLRCDGEDTSVVLQGAVLEAAIELEDGVVLVLSEDVPWEEGIHIHLLDADLALRDSVAMGWPYTPGLFTGLQLHEPDAIDFSFPADTRWRVTVLPRRRWAVRTPDWWPGIARSSGWWRWLELNLLTG